MDHIRKVHFNFGRSSLLSFATPLGMTQLKALLNIF